MRRRMGFVITLFVQGVRHLVPLLIGVAWFIFRLVLTAVASLFRGVPVATDQLAREQLEAVMQSGRLPSIYYRHFYWAVRILAVLVVILGWICWSFATVYLLMLLF